MRKKSLTRHNNTNALNKLRLLTNFIHITPFTLLMSDATVAPAAPNIPLVIDFVMTGFVANHPLYILKASKQIKSGLNRNERLEYSSQTD